MVHQFIEIDNILYEDNTRNTTTVVTTKCCTQLLRHHPHQPMTRVGKGRINGVQWYPTLWHHREIQSVGLSLWRASGVGCSVCIWGNGKWRCRWVVRGGKETEGKGGEEPSMQSREQEIEMRMGGEGAEGDSEKGNLGGAVDWDGGGGRNEKIKRVVLSWC